MKFLWLIPSIFAAQAAFAQPASNRTALIIGVGEYGYAGANALDGVQYDMVSAAKIAKAMGIPETNIRYIRNSEATKPNILTALKTLGDSTTEGSRAFVYFSGHGTRQQDGEACIEGLLTYEGGTITNSEFASATQSLTKSADKVVTMIDACHSEGVVLPKGKTRSIGLESFTPKFFMKSGSGSKACSTVANYRTRGLLPEVTRLGGLQENFVQITSSRPDEVSFDQPGLGGLATQGIRDCMLGKAKDLDGSGAVSMSEIQQCAQESINEKLKSSVDLAPHHITVTGTRNLIPVQRPVTQVVASLTPVQQTPVQPVKPEPAKPAVQTTVATQLAVITPAPAPAPVLVPVAAVTTAPVLNPPPEPVLASLATLKDIEQQRNPRRVVDVKLGKPTLKIGKGSLDLSIKSNHDGYVYLILLGSDAKSFYVLYPNGLDKNNVIKAGQTVRIPKPDWEVKSAGPEGTNNLLVLVSDSPRKLDTLTMAEPTANEPFTYALNDIGGRAALINFLTTSDGQSESFGAKLLTVKEVK